MKTKLTLFIALLVCFINPTISIAQDDNVAPKEYTLNLAPHVLSLGDLLNEIEAFNTAFRLNGQEIINMSETFDGNELVDIIERELNSFITNDIRGALFYYSLDSKNNLKIYIVPCLARTINIYASPIDFQYLTKFDKQTLDSILINKTAPVYEFDNDAFVKTSGDVGRSIIAQNNWKSYRRSINRVEIENNSTPNKNINQKNTDDTDGYCIYFPLQEIKALINENPTQKHLIIQAVGKPDTDDRSIMRQHLALYTTSQDLSKVGSEEYKKSVIAAKDFILNKYSSDPKRQKSLLDDPILIESFRQTIELFQGKAANLGQLCPTKCKGFQVLDRIIQP
jgi:hypothetical protein